MQAVHAIFQAMGGEFDKYVEKLAIPRALDIWQPACIEYMVSLDEVTPILI